MDPKPPSLDPVEVAKVIAGVLLSPKLAAVVGPYSLIILVAMAGAASALSNREPSDRTGSFFFFTWTTILSVTMTVPAATLVANYNDTWDAQWFFVPMAFLLAYIGDRWKELIGAVIEAFRTLLRQWANAPSPKDPP